MGLVAMFEVLVAEHHAQNDKIIVTVLHVPNNEIDDYLAWAHTQEEKCVAGGILKSYSIVPSILTHCDDMGKSVTW